MNQLALYHRLPATGRMVVANLRGLFLSWLRYGTDTNQQVREAIEHEQWSTDERIDFENRSTLRLLDQARDSPYHSAHAYSRSNNLVDWPILTKEPLRKHHRSMIATSQSARLYRMRTSGSTGTPTTLWINRRDIQRWYSLFEARWRRWYGLDRTDRWAMLGGQMIVPPRQTKPPFGVWNNPMKQLYLSAIHLRPDTVGWYRDALIRRRIRYFYGYPSGISDLCRLIADTGIEAPQLDLVLTDAEPLYPHERDLISRTFNCPVRDTYGMAEMVVGASECEAERLHLWPEAGRVEVLDDEDKPVPPGEVGRLICTGFINTSMPLIRYETGDLVAIEPPEVSCSCGRTLPLLKSIDGRINDVVLTVDGRRIMQLCTVFKSELPIRKAQIIQTEIGQFKFNIIPATGYNEQTEEYLRKALLDRVGQAEAVFELVEDIPLGPNRKFRDIISIPGQNLRQPSA